MQLRRFTADTTPAALAAVRMALGDDAIILANRRVGNQVEIIATGQMDDVSAMAESSIDDLTSTLAARPADTQRMHAGDSMGAFEPSSPVRIDADIAPDIDSDADRGATVDHRQDTRDRHADTDAVTQEIGNDTVSISNLSHEIDAEPGARLKPASSNVADIRSATASTRPVQSTNGSSAFGGKPAGQVAHPPVEAPSLSSLATAMEQHFKGLEVNLWGVNAPNRSLHLQQLMSLGIGAELATRLVEQCSPDMSVDSALRHSFAVLKSSLPIGRDKTLSVPGVTIMYGPPGAGKTTALIKLATEHVRQNDNQSIVIICADTRRIGAFEELQAYGRLLGVPTVHAHDAAELTSLTAAFTHKKLVLIDHTLPRDERSVPLPQTLLRPANQDSVRHLFALPATTQSSTAEALIAKHCTDGRMQLVLTNLDTSARLGELLNAIIRHETPVAYWSDDASVQRPLQRADASVLIATAVAMRKRLQQSPDDQWLHRLIQPSNHVFDTSTEAAEGSVQKYA